MSLLDLFKKKGSGDVAKDRLKLLLVSDRANCSPEVMEMIKTSTESDSNNGSVPALFANIPIKDIRNSDK